MTVNPIKSEIIVLYNFGNTLPTDRNFRFTTTTCLGHRKRHLGVIDLNTLPFRTFWEIGLRTRTLYSMIIA